MNRKEKLDIGAMHRALEALKPLINRVAELSNENLKIFEELESLQAGRDLTLPAPAPAPVVGTDNDVRYDPLRCGLNIPWLDFGNDIVGRKDWGKKSLAHSEDKRTMLRNLFIVALQEGFGVIRFWMLPTLWHGREGLYTHEQIAEAKNSTAILCEIARDVGVKLVPTILSFDNYSEEKILNNDAFYPFANNTHVELVSGIASELSDNHDVIDFVDIMNEPEWATRDLEGGDPKPGAIDKVMVMRDMRIISDMFRKESNLPIGYGSASLKWRGQYGTHYDVRDFHAYDWSIPHFPPVEASGNNLYMGETHLPYADWEELFKDRKYSKIFLWLEKHDYRNTKTLQAKLRIFKEG